MSVPTIVKLQTLLDNFNQAHTAGEVTVKHIDTAPWWLRKLFNGGYCAYKNTIYVPQLHLDLTAATNDDFNILATASMIQYFGWLYHRLANTFWDMVKLRYTNRGWHCFLYTDMMLKTGDSSFRPDVTVGFVSSRVVPGLLGFPTSVNPDEVINYMISVYEASNAVLEAPDKQVDE